ncbi:phage virion morphogenesis protein [Pseudomonas sihuiensis]|uniref:Phage virion morphogenesis (Putative tail completion) protein n=1 Tax=Pseudomonas sihuiensis TaxID=1274359 RepID=A0A1H2L364_9PSED|nr:phage virion morphogenesis protein [Pseudomonas sihuiensis]SDU75420.1 phage virion morphogenesis (putative tail completion) protein [Pseudomonas sihuiensis]
MSGARVELEFDNAAVLTAVRGALAELADPRPMLLDIGEALVNSTRDRFSAQRGPDGQTWKSLSPRYLATKSPNPGKILQRRGDLVRQIFPQVEGATLLVGTDRVYGAVHQFGALKGAFGKTRRGAPIPWGDIAARPFLGISDDDAAEIIAIARDHLQARLQG